MKTFRILFLCCVGLLADGAGRAPLLAEEAATLSQEPLFARVVTFRVPTQSALEIVGRRIRDDAELYRQLVDQVASGEVQLVVDQTVSAVSNKEVKVEAGSELVYPTSWGVASSGGLAVKDTTSRKVGDLLQLNLISAPSFPVVDGSVEFKTVRVLGRQSVPLLFRERGSWREETVELPFFFEHVVSTVFASVNGEPLLVSLQSEGNEYDEPEFSKQATRVTFVIAQKSGAWQPHPFTEEERADMGSLPRVHTLGFRVPSHFAEEWLSEASLDDTGRFQQAVALVREGQATVIHHAACLTRSGNPCSTRSAAHTRTAVDWVLVGHGNRPALDVGLRMEKLGRPERERVVLEAGALALESPAVPRTAFQTQLTLPLGWVCLLGGASVPVASETAPLTDVYFLACAPESWRGPNEEPFYNSWARAKVALYLLSPDEAQAAEATMENVEEQRLVAQEVEQRWREGRVALLEQRAFMAQEGAPVKWETGVERLVKLAAPPPTESGNAIAITHRETEGFTLEASWVRAEEKGGVTLNVAGSYDAAPAAWPAAAGFLAEAAEAEEGGSILAATRHRISFTYRNAEPFMAAESRLVAVHPLPVTTSPQAGSWLAVVVQVTNYNSTQK